MFHVSSGAGRAGAIEDRAVPGGRADASGRYLPADGVGDAQRLTSPQATADRGVGVKPQEGAICDLRTDPGSSSSRAAIRAECVGIRVLSNRAGAKIGGGLRPRIPKSETRNPKQDQKGERPKSHNAG